MKRRFNKKTVVITGAAGGFGTAFAKCFGRHGANLGLLDLNKERLSHLEKELSDQGIACSTHSCDVTEHDQCKVAIDQVLERFGSIDCLINNAGLTHRSAFLNTDPGTYRKVMDVNLFGSIHCTKAAINSLIENRGMIIVISSLAGFLPLFGRTGYSASKHALHGFFDSLRTEMKEKGVSVMIACPGFADTDFSRSALDGDGSVTKHPRSTVGRLSSADQVASDIFKAATNNKRLLVMSPAGKVSRLIIKIWPSLYDKLMVRSLKSELEGRD